MGNPSRLFICRKINSRLRVMMRGAQRIVALFLCPDANSLLAAINEITKGGQNLMGHSDIGVTLNTYTHLGLEDAEDELERMEELESARSEQAKMNDEPNITQNMFRVG